VPDADHQTQISPDPKIGEKTGPPAPDATSKSNDEKKEEQGQIIPKRRSLLHENCTPRKH
jgi:hypothetical protein